MECRGMMRDIGERQVTFHLRGLLVSLALIALVLVELLIWSPA